MEFYLSVVAIVALPTFALLTGRWALMSDDPELDEPISKRAAIVIGVLMVLAVWLVILIGVAT